MYVQNVHSLIVYMLYIHHQCFDAGGLVTERASGSKKTDAAIADLA